MLVSFYIGLCSSVVASLILIPDVITTIISKRNKMSNNYLIMKSISVIVNLLYSTILWDDYGIYVGLPIFITSCIKIISLCIFCVYSRCEKSTYDELN